MKNVVLSIILAVLLGCAKSNVDEREKYWAGSVEAFLQITRDLESLSTWLTEQGVEASIDSTDEYYSVVLERIPGDGKVCSEWQVTLYFELNDKDEVYGPEIDSLGICL